MKQIKFRGRSIRDKRYWLEGGYCCRRETTHCCGPEAPTHHYIAADTMTDWELPNELILHEVDPKTVSQSTGLMDKNGKEVFEDDILKGYTYPYLYKDEFNYYAMVVWFENCPAFGLFTFKAPGANVSGISTGDTDFIENWNSSNWEIIGNIHDNPDLTKEVSDGK